MIFAPLMLLLMAAAVYRRQILLDGLRIMFTSVLCSGLFLVCYRPGHNDFNVNHVRCRRLEIKMLYLAYLPLILDPGSFLFQKGSRGFFSSGTLDYPARYSPGFALDPYLRTPVPSSSRPFTLVVSQTVASSPIIP
jgi:hypothetical protein